MKIKPVEVAQAIHIINRYAKLSIETQLLYKMKNDALDLLILTGDAKKVGLDIYKDPRNGRKRTFVSVKIENFYFHMSPTKADFFNLQHIKNEEKTRNPLVNMDLSEAKHTIMTYSQKRNKIFEFK
ncbi:YkyB family protein [Fredinandcohnia salidurans]|uniref:YkyB family protein n=1 Tax=Fredinandcohnia salidurans TaxID=2595041 RepID=A0ABW4MVG3_9BACI